MGDDGPRYARRLQPCLGGIVKVSLICTVKDGVEHIEDFLGSLRRSTIKNLAPRQGAKTGRFQGPSVEGLTEPPRFQLLEDGGGGN